jgi:hypothetical protein
MSQHTFDLIARMLEARASAVDLFFALLSSSIFGYFLPRSPLHAFGYWAASLALWVLVVVALRQLQAIQLDGLFPSDTDPADRED